MTTTAVTPTDEFEDFYQANFAGTVMLIYSITADMPAAQDVAQEAFARAWQRWRKVSEYDNPLAWVRRVSINLANSRWRKLRTARAYLDRQREEHSSEVSADHVAVVAALRKLPKNQREALVLHYLADMPVHEVAQHLDVPLGTVKSWLHRGRAALAGELTLEVPAFTTAATKDVVRLGSIRQRVRVATITASAVLALACTLAIVTLVNPAANHTPVSPSLPPGCRPGEIPVSLVMPEEAQISVTVLNGSTVAGVATTVADELRNRQINVGGVVDTPNADSPDATARNEVAIIRYGPKAVGSAHVIRAYLLDEATMVFELDRLTEIVDLVIGGRFKQLATPSEMRQAAAILGRPALPAGTCNAAS